VIVDYVPHAGTTAKAAFKALTRVFEREGGDLADAEAVCEGAVAPREQRPGRAYLAVKYDLLPATVLARLRAANPSCDLILIHPTDDA